MRSKRSSARGRRAASHFSPVGRHGGRASIQYGAWRTLVFLATRLPPGVLYGAADIAGGCAYYGWSGARHRMCRNFTRVLAGGDQVGRTARRSLQNYCRYLVDFARLGSREPAGSAPLRDGDDAFAQLDTVLARGRGAVMVAMHFGNWDAGALAAAARGYPVSAVAERFSDERVTREVFAARERLGLRILPLERPGPSLLRALTNGGLLALLIDRSVPGKGVRVRFFGAEVEVPAGPAQLALRSGAALVPIAFPRVRRDAADVLVLADFSIDTTPGDDRTADIRRLTQAVMTAHEAFIRRYPEQWYKFGVMWAGDS